MSQYLGVLSALPEDLRSIPSIHMVMYNYLQLQLQGVQLLPLESQSLCTHEMKKLFGVRGNK